MHEDTIEEQRHTAIMAKLNLIQGEFTWYPITAEYNPIREHGLDNDDMVYVLYETGEVDTFCAGDVAGHSSVWGG